MALLSSSPRINFLLIYINIFYIAEIKQYKIIKRRIKLLLDDTFPLNTHA